MTLTLPSPAKLNLYLAITGRRADGYHNLQTLFQLLDYGDTMSFDITGDRQLKLSPALPGVANDDNLIIRAAKLLQHHCHCGLGADIHIKKILPMGGGIGGGSSNAATTLLALNQLWQCGLSTDQLAALGLQLGADVPVFVRGHTAWAEGVGEQLQAIEIPESWYLVVKPDCEVSTAEIFSHKQLTRNSSPITIAAVFEGAHGNDCEAVVRSLYPKIDKALNWLNRFAAAQLTGTGSCIFARFDTRDQADAVLEQVPGDMQGFVARGVNHSPVHRLLNC